MAGRLSPQDKKDLDKFTKFFIFKSLQIIVQSRLGEKLKSKSKVTSSGIDWFNLSITDIPEVQAEVKKTLSGLQPLLSQTINVEISLRTMEGASMVLETWSLSMNTELIEPDVKEQYDSRPMQHTLNTKMDDVSSTVYNRMTLALKSVFSVSRMPPAYRLSRRQGGTSADDFVICYRLYRGLPQTGLLGEDYKTTRVGSVPTPVGTIVISLAYRTNLLMPQNHYRRGVPFDLKDDHFSIQNGLQTAEPRPCNLGFKHGTSSDDLRRLEGMETQDLCSTTFSNSPPDIGHMLHVHKQVEIQKGIVDKTETKSRTPEQEQTFESLYRIPAFIQDEVRQHRVEKPEDRPFAALMAGLPSSFPLKETSAEEGLDSESEDEIDGENDEEENKDIEEESDPGDLDEIESLQETSARSSGSTTDEFVMVSLKTPFAATDPTADLGQFYRELQEAPQLEMCKSVTVTEDFLSDLKAEIDLLASKQDEINAFIRSLDRESDLE